jgi:hypothetical protein
MVVLPSNETTAVNPSSSRSLSNPHILKTKKIPPLCSLFLLFGAQWIRSRSHLDVRFREAETREPELPAMPASPEHPNRS